MAEALQKYKRATALDEQRKVRKLAKTLGQIAVFVITMAASFASILEFGVTRTAVTISILVLLLLLSVFSNILSYFDTRMRQTRAKHVAFLIPSSGDQPFYSAMLCGLARSALLPQGQNYVIVPSLPVRSFEEVSVWSLFSDLEDRQVEIDGIIFIPASPDKHFDELVGFHENRGDIPLVMVDVYFDIDVMDTHTRARLPSFVGGDESIGGRLAAEIVLDVIVTPPAKPRVIIVNGASSPWEQKRALAFKTTLAASWKNVVFSESPPINYSRAAAYEWTRKTLPKVATFDKCISVSAVFACNDDMAIGVRNAILHLTREGYKFPILPQIVGYDGITEMREYIEANDAFIAGTVDVRIEEQARAAMLLIHKLIRGGERKTEVHLVEPLAIRRADKKESASAPIH
jgi:ABC-type sugar transport system substrate-binding protein